MIQLSRWWSNTIEPRAAIRQITTREQGELHPYSVRPGRDGDEGRLSRHEGPTAGQGATIITGNSAVSFGHKGRGLPEYVCILHAAKDAPAVR